LKKQPATIEIIHEINLPITKRRVHFDLSHAVSIAVISYSWSTTTGDHFIHMCRHLQAATTCSVHEFILAVVT